MKLKRAIYLGYYLKKLDGIRFKQFLEYTVQQTGKSRVAILYDILLSVFKYNISILEYFQFRFFELDENEKKGWAGTGYMYEFQLRMNPIEKRSVLEDKPEFVKQYADFIKHDHATLAELKENAEKAQNLLGSGKLVLKRSDGGSGKGIIVIDTDGLNRDQLIKLLIKSGNDMVEEYVVQHQELMRLSPSGLNTIRIITQVKPNKEVAIVGCRLRISVDSHVDNMAAGNIAATVDSNSGVVTSHAVYSDMTRDPIEKHPITGIKIKGFQLPFWDETIEMVKKAALVNTSNRSIGWDVAITDNGPELIEGNHDWCKLLWQLPERKGLKNELEAF